MLIPADRSSARRPESVQYYSDRRPRSFRRVRQPPSRRAVERILRQRYAPAGGHRIAERASGQQWPQKGTKDLKRFLVLFVPFCGENPFPYIYFSIPYAFIFR